jgi:transcriptional regulator with XRE-family HTH domain
MKCAACAATADGWDHSPFCPACYSVAGGPLPAVVPTAGSPLWLWTSAGAASALATGNLTLIVKAYRTATRTSQADLAAALGYDTSYISMIENGRRTISDVASLRRFARHLGVPPHVLGVTDPQDADFATMIQFGESTIRLASVAREAGHGAAAINELWPLIWRLETRAADGYVGRGALRLLGRARAMLGVALGDVLPEEKLVSSVRWTGRALSIAQHLGDSWLLCHALRVHGNELRKAGRQAAAAARLQNAADIAEDAERGPVLIQLARAAADLGNAGVFDATVADLRRIIDTAEPTPVVNPFVLREVRLRGLLATRRPDDAAYLATGDTPDTTGVAPQWRAIERVTAAEVHRRRGDKAAAANSLRQSIATAEAFRLPHQIQRAMRAAQGHLPEVEEAGSAALGRLGLSLPPAQSAR